MRDRGERQPAAALHGWNDRGFLRGPRVTKKITIASASSAEYFHFLQGMILSVRDKPQSKDVDISLYDLGLTAE
jgi:hypothetical protein